MAQAEKDDTDDNNGDDNDDDTDDKKDTGSDEAGRSRDGRQSRHRKGQGGKQDQNGGKRRLPGLETVERAKQQLSLMTGRHADSVSAIGRAEGGWRMTVEVVDLERIPPTTNVMASYEAEFDDDGNLVEYELVRRYTRGQTDSE
jgi:Gas vesicle synthesis protein GvpO